MRIETKWAVIITVIILLWMLIAQALGLFTVEKIQTGQMIGSVVSISAYIIGYFMVTREKREVDYDGYMTWGEGFWAAARMTLIYIPISSIVLYLYIQYLNPGYKAFVASDNFGKDPVNTFLFGNLYASFIFGGLFCLIFPFFTRKSINKKA